MSLATTSAPLPARPVTKLLGTTLTLMVLSVHLAIADLPLDDPQSALQRTKAPVSATFKLTKSQRRAAQETRLGVVLKQGEVIPTQWDLSKPEARATWLMPGGTLERCEFQLQPNPKAFVASMVAAEETGQFGLREGEHRVLRYNYRPLEPGTGFLAQVGAGNKIYARARGDYIHPLLGPQGEELTCDWAVDHPHHRGIYWAWPEVEYGSERGDLHALQKVFARPTGRIRLESGPVLAQITAENEWRWDDREPIVREIAVIRAYRHTDLGRVIDLAFQFVALRDGVTLARRDTDKYGGLNVRMATPEAQQILPFLDQPSAVPRRAWSDLSGRFAGATANAGLLVLQSATNPDYPGDWVQYPNLSWCQPTFPRAGSRFPLVRNKPLVLRFRLLVHEGTAATNERAAQLWDAYHAPGAAAPEFNFDKP